MQEPTASRGLDVERAGMSRIRGVGVSAECVGTRPVLSSISKPAWRSRLVWIIGPVRAREVEEEKNHLGKLCLPSADNSASGSGRGAAVRFYQRAALR